MDSFTLFWGTLLIAVILITLALIFFAYWIPKKAGKKKLGFWLSGLLTLAIVLFVVANKYEDSFFFKSDVRKTLRAHNMELKDDFSILFNQSGGLKDYSHQFKLTISDSDKKRLVSQILQSENYVNNDQPTPDLINDHSRYTDTLTSYFANYCNGPYYVHEFYLTRPKGGAPIWEQILIAVTGNELQYFKLID